MGNLLHGLRHLVLSGEQEDELDLSVRRWRPEIALTLPVRRGDAMRNFRELLWFWGEYYLRRGRDRLSLEFSSHVRFPEWFSVVGEWQFLLVVPCFNSIQLMDVIDCSG